MLVRLRREYEVAYYYGKLIEYEEVRWRIGGYVGDV